MNSVDVLILGGGPAGCAAAIALACSGRRVAVLERSRYEQVRVGETLPPDASVLLRRLGVWEAFTRAAHLPSPGTVSVWGQAEPYENDFLFSPYGHGWHLDRRRFDEMLAMAAGEAGAAVHRDTRVLACTADSSGRWQVEFQTDGCAAQLGVSFLIDATGRASWLARRLGSRRLVVDRLVGVAGVFRVGEAAPQHDRRTLLEAAETGWWYSALLPDNCLAVAHMTDRDFLPEAPRNLDDFWAARIRQTAHTLDRLGDGARLGNLRIVSADSYRMDPVAGENWLAVGDAAMAWDPLAAQGITKALESGLAAAPVAQIRDRRSGGPEAYATTLAGSFEHYLRLHARYYGEVRRWPESLFWARRRRRIAEEKPESGVV